MARIDEEIKDILAAYSSWGTGIDATEVSITGQEGKAEGMNYHQFSTNAKAINISVIGQNYARKKAPVDITGYYYRLQIPFKILIFCSTYSDLETVKDDVNDAILTSHGDGYWYETTQGVERAEDTKEHDTQGWETTVLDFVKIIYEQLTK